MGLKFFHKKQEGTPADRGHPSPFICAKVTINERITQEKIVTFYNPYSHPGVLGSSIFLSFSPSQPQP